MLKKLLLASAISMALISTSTYAADAAYAGKTEQAAKKSATNIAVVNLRLIMAELPQAKAESEAMQKEFGPRSEELQKIQQEGAKLEAELQKSQGDKATELQRKLAKLKADYDLKGQALQEDSQKRQREAEMKLGKLIQTAIDRIAKERGIELVVRGESVVFASDAVDISEEVIARASKLKPAKKENKDSKK
ncbi:MAG: OmpH family outer membrane protein [Succinivibrio sp.]|nr:OmpH family outer membrane protein [Succinivibrio sp.]